MEGKLNEDSRVGGRQQKLGRRIITKREELEEKKVIKKTVESSTRASTLRRNVFNKLPKDYQLSHSYYIRNYFHGFFYFFLFFLSYYLQYKVYNYYHDNCTSHTCNIVLFSLTYIVSPCFVGWTVCGLIGFGHNGLHNGFAPCKTRLGKLLNWLMHKLTWDLLLATTSVKDHMFHHKYTNTKNDTSMLLISMNCGVFGEVLHTMLFSFGKFTVDDIILLFSGVYNNNDGKHQIKQKIDLLDRLWIIIILVIRFALLLGTVMMSSSSNEEYIEFRPLMGFLNLVASSFFINMFLYLPHVSPAVVSSDDDDESSSDMYIHELRNAWEMYPSNSKFDHFMQFVHCHATMHVTHHCFSYIPPSLYSLVSHEIYKVYKNEYRSIRTIKDEINLYMNRKVYANKSDLFATRQD